MSTGHRLRSAAGAALAALATGPAFAQPVHEDFKLIASDGAAFDYFGASVAISGTTAIVGAPRDDDNGSESGSAYLIDLSNPNNIIETKLVASDGNASARFGGSVAVSGTVAIVGGYQDDDLGLRAGSAYLFDTSTGAQIAKLTASDGSESDRFGYSVAISGTTAIVGAWNESAYLFDFSDPDNIVETVLTASDAKWRMHFGYSVAISGTTAIVGAWLDDDNGLGSGSAYLFDFSDPDNIVETKLTASDGASGDKFGYSVAISGTTAIVGAWLDDDNGLGFGSAYLFDISDRENIVETKLTASDGWFQYFGYSVAISGTTAIVGAYRDDGDGYRVGSAYVFDFSNAGCITETKLTASDGGNDDEFGQAVAISDTAAIVGAHQDSLGDFQRAGSAYVFDVTPACAADLNSDGRLSFFDVSAFLTAFNDQDPAADFNCDTRYDFFDVAAFIVAFGRGCP